MPPLQTTLMGRFVEQMQRAEHERLFALMAAPRQPYTGSRWYDDPYTGNSYRLEVVDDVVVRAVPVLVGNGGGRAGAGAEGHRVGDASRADAGDD